MADDPRRQEKQLVERSLAGDPDAGERLIQIYSPRVAETIRATFRRFSVPAETADVQDLVQETFAGLWKEDKAALRRFRWACPFPNYLAAITASRAIDHLRKIRKDLPLDSADPEGANASARLATDADASLPIEAAELRDKVHRGLAGLPENERLALRLYYWDSLSTEAIGRVLDMKGASVWSLLSRARARLRDLLRNSLYCL